MVDWAEAGQVLDPIKDLPERYLGSKAASGAYQAIIAQMPPHDLYIETHLGPSLRQQPR